MKQLSLVFIISCLVGCFGAEPETTGLEGKVLPEFNLLLPDSTTWFNTGKISMEKPIALFYFSSSCPYCRAQTQEIIDDIDKLKNIQFYFVTGPSLHEMKAFYNEFQLSKYPNITIGIDTGRFVANYFEVSVVPYIAIYGKDKRLNKVFNRQIYSSQIKKAAEE